MKSTSFGVLGRPSDATLSLVLVVTAGDLCPYYLGPVELGRALCRT